MTKPKEGQGQERYSQPAGVTNLRRNPANVCICATCIEVRDDSIGCDRCTRWFHSRVLCMGVSQGVIDVISDSRGAGVAFICTDCRCRIDE